MKKLRVSDFIESISGQLIKGDCSAFVDHVAIKPGKIKNTTLYFDLYKHKGVKLSSINKNSSFVMVTANPEMYKYLGGNITVIKVKHITTAYRSFISYYRSLFDIPVIGVTGTCGKTTTKEMIKHILSSKYSNIVATYRSKNQRPYNLKYLQQIDESTEIATIEMGVTWPNDLLIYCRYFKPQIGVITNIGIDHLDQCGTPEKYIKAKAKLLDGLGNQGTVIVNADDNSTKKVDFSNYKGRIIYFGFNEYADFAGSDLTTVGNGMKFTLKHENKYYEVFLPILGDFNAYNALAAIAASYEAGIKIEEAIEKLKSFVNIEKHFHLARGVNGCRVIDDTWSTNPTSAAAAIQVLKKYSEGKKTIAVLGRMNLLGKNSAKFHRRLGHQIAEVGINTLITTDHTSKYIGIGALAKGMSSDCIYHCNNLSEIMSILKNLLDENTLILVKTSMLDSYKSLMHKLIIK